MHLSLKAWAAALGVASLTALLTLYVTRPASPQQATSSAFAGRDYPGVHSPDPVTGVEVGYRIPRDKIKAIDAPTFLPAGEARSIPDQVPVIGVVQGGEARAYPVPILSRVEIVNDEIAGRAIAVTW